MQIDFYPFTSSDNLYLDIIETQISNDSFKIEPFEVNLKKWIFGKSNTNIVHFNWFDNIDAGNLYKTYLRYFKRIIILKILKMRKIKIVCTIHNKLPHNTNHANLAKEFQKKLYSYADAITILSSDTKNVLKEQFGYPYYEQNLKEKIVHIPHPNYINSYPDLPNEIFKVDPNIMTFLFVGAVKPYKNIELIIDVARNFYTNNLPAKFIIAGNGSSDYIEELRKKCKNIDNIELIPRFVENKEMQGVLRSVDILILPYDIKSSLNSGTCYLAFSYGKNVICPEIGTIKDIDPNLCYSYKYKSDQEHFENLMEACLKAHTDYYTNKKFFNEKNKKLLEFVQSHNDPQTIGSQYRNLYTQLMNT